MSALPSCVCVTVTTGDNGKCRVCGGYWMIPRGALPAFPSIQNQDGIAYNGLTIREMFVKDIFCAFIARGHRFERSRNQAIEQADAILDALQRGEGE